MKHNTDEEKLEYLKQYDREDSVGPEEEREEFRASGRGLNIEK